MPRPRTRRTATKAEPAERGTGSLYKVISDRLNKKIGENTVADMGSEEFVASTVTEYISTQCFALDWAMHLPGVPVGRVWCIRGDFMSGKSTIALHVLAETQKMGGFAVYIDTEYAFDKDRAKAIGIDLSEDNWLLIQADTVEATVKSLRELCEIAMEEHDAGNDRLVTIVWDSVGATSTEAEMEAEFGESRPGVHARLLSAALRQLTPKIAKYRISLGILNQEKDKVDFFSMGKDTKTMTAEKPIMFHSSVVLRPQHRMTLTNAKKEPIGIRVVTTVRKNKLAAPFSKAEFVIRFATGIDSDASVLSVALANNLVKKSGSWYSYDGQKFHEGDFSKILKAHPEIMEDLEAIRDRSNRAAAVDDFEEESNESDVEDAEE